MAVCNHLRLVLLLSFVPLLVVRALQCPKGLVSVDDDGSLTFRPLSPGSEDSIPSYDPGVIGGWYSLSSGFIEVVRSGSLPYDAIKSGLKSLNVPCSIPGLQNNCTAGQTLTTSAFDPAELIESFVGWLAGIIAVTVFGGLLAFSFLICGCCFWCCRCCGNCGGGKTQKISRSMDYKSFALSIILLLFVLLLLVGVIFAFFSNEQTFRSLDNFQDSIHTVTGTGVDFLNDTLTEVEELLCQLAAPDDSVTSIVLDEARGFSAALGSELNRIGDEVFDVLETLDSLPAGLISTINVLSNISSNTLALATSFNTLQTTLDTIRTQISNLLLNCSNNVMNEEICNMIRSSGEINTEANYSALPDVNSQLLAVSQALEDLNLNELVEEGRQNFDNISQSITTSTDEIINSVTSELQSVIGSASDAVGTVIDSIKAFLDRNLSRVQCPPINDGSVFRNLEANINNIRLSSSSRQVLNVGYVQQCIVNQGFDYIQQYDAYRYGFGIVICSISLVTIVFVLVGIAFGMIGFKKKVAPSERTSLSHCGGVLLLIGVSVTFLIGFLLMILAALMFFFGAGAQKICLAMEGPGYPLFTEVMDDQEFWGGSLGGQLFQAVNPDATDAVLSITAALRNCERNQALFSAFNLSNLLPTGSVSMQIQTMANFSEVGNVVDGLVNEAADNFNNFTNTSFLPMEAQMALSQYMEANVQDINITEFDEELNRTLLLFNVSETIDVFTNISGLLNEPTGVTGQASTDEQALVNSIIANLCIVEDQIPIIIEQVIRLSADIRQLEMVIETSVLTTSRVVATINSLIRNITGPTLIRFLDNTVGVTIEQTIDYVFDYIIHLEDVVTKDISRCQPLWGIYTSTYNSVCGVFLDGLNGFWWSLGFCSVLFIPVIIFCIITSTCYLRRKSEEIVSDAQAVYPMKSLSTDQEKNLELSQEK